MSTASSIVIGFARGGRGLLLAAACWTADVHAEEAEAIHWPEGAVVELAGDASSGSGEWGGILVALLDSTTLPIDAGWEAGRTAGRSLFGEDTAWLHLQARSPEDWLHARRWRDPNDVASRLRAAGARPLGGGRFELDSGRLVATLAEGWMLIRPAATRWRPPVAARLRSLDEAPAVDGATVAVTARMRHEPPVDGVTSLTLRPRGRRTAEIEVVGRYASNPLGEGVSMPLDPAILGGLADRFAATILESGLALVDPRLVDAAIEVPDLVPPPAVRRHLQARRLLVLDTVEDLEGLRTPAFGVAVPLQGMDGRPTAFVEAVDDWMDGLAGVLWGRWNLEPAPEIVSRKDDPIRHRPLGEGFSRAMGRHPAALGASLNWLVLDVEDPSRPGWLILGSTRAVVEGVRDSLDRAVRIADGPPMAMAGAFRPSAVGAQVRSLSQVRRRAEDDRGETDAALLDRLAEALGALERVEWMVVDRTPTSLDLTIDVERRVPDTVEGDP